MIAAMKFRALWIMILFSVLFALTLLGSLCLGSVPIGLHDVAAVLLQKAGISADNADKTTAIIVWQLRLPRTLLAGLAGAVLGTAGAVLQGLFRNPLADPYSLGLSSGASIGAVGAITLGWHFRVALFAAVPSAAFVGAIFSAVLVYGISRANKRASPTIALLLAGTAVGAFLSALVSLIVSLNDKDLHIVFFWLLGGFGGKSWADLASVLMPAGLAIAGAQFLARPLDVLGAGEETAGTLGINLQRLRSGAVIIASLGAASAVSAGGVIGFIGLLGPHMARLFVGPLHRRLIPASALTGAVLLMLADAVARWIAAPLELPVGVITALIGAPLFLRLLTTGQEVRS
ncbi:MAG: FecCD family ABC transporter permease [Rectinema subterraneum]|uniref:FecCD family ABC transporter permease n=1 Tax=Rectinema subterraneum TaxID=2653714 RepID=UPI003C79D8FA